nr:hypothetical protein [Micromonospora sp. DSM 115978]
MAAIAAEYGWLLLAAGMWLLAMQSGWWMRGWHDRMTWGDARPEAAAPRVAVQPAATDRLAGPDVAGDPADPAGRAGSAGQTAAGDDMGPGGWSGDHTDRGTVESDPVDGGRAAPAPTGPVATGPGGGHPDDLMAVAAAALTPDEVPVVPGLSDDDMVGRTVMAAIDLLAASLLASNEDDEDGAQRCEDRCRHLLADDLTKADLVDVLMEELMCSAGDRARAIRAETDALDPAAIGGAL